MKYFDVPFTTTDELHKDHVVINYDDPIDPTAYAVVVYNGWDWRGPRLVTMFNARALDGDTRHGQMPQSLNLRSKTLRYRDDSHDCCVLGDLNLTGIESTIGLSGHTSQFTAFLIGGRWWKSQEEFEASSRYQTPDPTETCPWDPSPEHTTHGDASFMPPHLDVSRWQQDSGVIALSVPVVRVEMVSMLLAGPDGRLDAERFSDFR